MIGFDKQYYILISGRMGTGKTHFAKLLTKYIHDNRKGYYAVIENFAGILKECAREFFLWNGLKDERGRKLLQDIGKVGREYDEDTWCKRLLSTVLSYPVPPNIVIVDDWRFPNEEAFLRSKEFINVTTVRIKAPTRENKESKYYNDVSETALKDTDTYDCTINNTIDGDDDLSYAAQLLLEYIEKGERL